MYSQITWGEAVAAGAVESGQELKLMIMVQLATIKNLFQIVGGL